METAGRGPRTVAKARYIPRGRNQLHTIFERHLKGFCDVYDERFASDAQYTDAEYRAKKAWGHSSYNWALRLARKAKVRHHEPDRDDATLDRIVADLNTGIDDSEQLRCEAVFEGMEAIIGRSG